MKKEISQSKLSAYENERSEARKAYHAIWGCCRRIAEYVAENDKILLNGICLGDASKLVDIDKKLFDCIAEASLKVKQYDRHHKKASALLKRYKFNP